MMKKSRDWVYSIVFGDGAHWMLGGVEVSQQALLDVGCGPGYAYVTSRIEPSEGLFSATFNSLFRSVKQKNF